LIVLKQRDGNRSCPRKAAWPVRGKRIPNLEKKTLDAQRRNNGGAEGESDGRGQSLGTDFNEKKGSCGLLGPYLPTRGIFKKKKKGFCGGTVESKSAKRKSKFISLGTQSALF